jgi:hypothetical protein
MVRVLWARLPAVKLLLVAAVITNVPVPVNVPSVLAVKLLILPLAVKPLGKVGVIIEPVKLNVLFVGQLCKVTGKDAELDAPPLNKLPLWEATVTWGPVSSAAKTCKEKFRLIVAPVASVAIIVKVVWPKAFGVPESILGGVNVSQFGNIESSATSQVIGVAPVAVSRTLNSWPIVAGGKVGGVNITRGPSLLPLSPPFRSGRISTAKSFDLIVGGPIFRWVVPTVKLLFAVVVKVNVPVPLYNPPLPCRFVMVPEAVIPGKAGNNEKFARFISLEFSQLVTVTWNVAELAAPPLYKLPTWGPTTIVAEGGGSAMVIVTSLSPKPATLVALTVKVKVPLAVGVPDKTPVLLRFIPAGKVLAGAISHVIGAVPAVVVNVKGV